LGDLLGQDPMPDPQDVDNDSNNEHGQDPMPKTPAVEDDSNNKHGQDPMLDPPGWSPDAGSDVDGDTYEVAPDPTPMILG
jgi:hypothetical protein